MTVLEYTDQVDALTPETLRDLCDLCSPCVSLYLPTRRDNTDRRADALALRGLVDDAAERLAAREVVDPEENARILTPLRRLVDDSLFWNEQADGLAVFADARGHHVFRLPVAPTPQAHVGDLPHLAPLVPVAFGDGEFHLLALSRNDVRLFTGRRDAIHETTLGPVPVSLEGMERRHEREPELQHQGEPRGGAGVATFHGHGGTEVDEVMVDKFLHEVAVTLRRRIGAGTHRPLVLASVAEYLPKLQASGALPTLVDRPVPGNPEAHSGEELLERAWPIVAETLDRRGEARAEQVAERRGAGTAALDPAEIARAGAEGRIATLLLREDLPLDDHERQRLDEAVCAALTTSADLHAVRELPDGAPYAALRRW